MILNAHTYYSLRFGTLSPEKLVQLAVENGYSSIALTDINNTTAWTDFVKACRQEKISPLIGIEFRKGNRLLYIGIARNNAGFLELNTYLSDCNLRRIAIPDFAPGFNDVFVVYPYECPRPERLRPNEFIGIRPSDLKSLSTFSTRSLLDHMVILSSVSFGSKSEYQLHCHLRAIENNTLLSKLDQRMLAGANDCFISRKQLLDLYAPWPLIIRNTEKIFMESSFDISFNVIRNRKTFTGNSYDDKILLEKLAREGHDSRFGKSDRVSALRLENELEIIDRLGFSAYFLITCDIVRYSMSRGFYHVGRGSGANSLVAYCLYITNVNPIELDLYFERFINPKRSSPPDFDIDFSWKDRGQVQDYIFKRYGSRHTALLGMMQTFRDKSVYRELGKVYGLPKAEIDALVGGRKTLKADDAIVKMIMDTAVRIQDFPNLRSIHAGGILISEKPIACYSALDLPPKGMPTVQWDMYVAEDLGFEKFDILSQRGIGHIHDAAILVRQNKGIDINVHQVEKFKQDPKLADMLENGDTNGCFYIESPAMRGLLKKLRCRNYLTLVAASSIIRPGVARSGMMKEYIHRFHQPEGFDYLHPIMRELLGETFGIMVYQEDVLKVVHHYAGLDLSDADVLRRAMSGKYRSKEEMQRIINRFFESAKKMGRPEAATSEIWRQIESFSGYSFSKAHSASFAVESFQSLFLKTYYPLEFMVAVINNFGGYYRSWVYFNEARKWGAAIVPPCVNCGEYLTSIHKTQITVGFIHILGLEQTVSERIIYERKNRGTYTSLANFQERLPIGREQLTLLIRAGAFRFTGKTKPQLLWEAQMLINAEVGQTAEVLFSYERAQFHLPGLCTSQLEDAYDEIELLGFPISCTWLDMLQTSFRGEILASGMASALGNKVRMIGILATLKPVRTIKNELMYFSTFIDAEGQFFDGVNFPPSLKLYPFRGNGIYLVYGRITEEFGFTVIEVEKMAKMPLQPDPRGG